MAKVKFDISQLTDFNKRVKLSVESKMVKDMATDILHTMGAEYVRVAKLNTPVGGGKEFITTPEGFNNITAFEVKKGRSYQYAKRNSHGGRTKMLKRAVKHSDGSIDYKVLTPSEHMRRSWQTGDVLFKGNGYKISVVNTASYASFVNDGHRQEPGRYVPAIGKRLVNNWVDGLFMAEKAENVVNKKANRIIKLISQEHLNKVFK